MSSTTTATTTSTSQQNSQWGFLSVRTRAHTRAHTVSQSKMGRGGRRSEGQTQQHSCCVITVLFHPQMVRQRERKLYKSDSMLVIGTPSAPCSVGVFQRQRREEFCCEAVCMHRNVSNQINTNARGNCICQQVSSLNQKERK